LSGHFVALVNQPLASLSYNGKWKREQRKPDLAWIPETGGKEMQELTERIARIRDDQDHGSRWLVRQTIILLHDLAVAKGDAPEQQLQQVYQVGRELARARPVMAALAGAVGRILAVPGALDGIARAAEHLLQDYDQALTRITTFARPYLQGTVMTHSLSGTVSEVLRACVPRLEALILLEGRPRYEGRTAVETLRSEAVALTLITDAQADIFLPFCQAVVVGADTLLADGSLLNKAGTALLARAARGHGVPFYVLSETLKISPQSWSGDLSSLEEQSSLDVWPDPPPGVAVRNFVFDHTPAELITAIITEQGLLSKADIQRQAADLLRFGHELT
jgi:translation initiation factor 2B subunit (eIF-2B alpha/beta/delta family)